MRKILLTNDDGIDAPGLQALQEATLDVGEPVVVAPVVELSGCGHRVTTSCPVRIERRAPQAHAVHGTPADCVRLGLYHIAPEAAWVLAGINAGGNLGADVHHSGTVAAVREAVIHGRPGIALSHYRKKARVADWPRACRWVAPLLRHLMARPYETGTFWNINLPSLEPDDPEPDVVFCPLDPNPLPLSFLQQGELFHYNGDYHLRRRNPGSDVDVCFRGQIAVTCVRLF
jgi:5'-nucleotidase